MTALRADIFAFEQSAGFQNLRVGLSGFVAALFGVVMCLTVLAFGWVRAVGRRLRDRVGAVKAVLVLTRIGVVASGCGPGVTALHVLGTRPTRGPPAIEPGSRSLLGRLYSLRLVPSFDCADAPGVGLVGSRTWAL